MDKKRSYRSSLYNKILDSLKEEALSISEISKKTGVNWETTRRTLEILKQIRILGEKEEKNRRMFFIKDSSILKIEDDTLFKIPLSKSQRETTLELFNKIKKEWVQVTKRPLNKTFMQKIAVKVIKNLQISTIPYGWYLFGVVAVLQYDPYQEIQSETNHLGNEYNNEISKTVKEFQRFKTTEELMIKQYMEEGNELYLTKLKLNGYFLNSFKDEDIPRIKRELRNLVFSFKETDNNKEIVELVNGFMSLVSQLFNKLNISELEDVRLNIYDSFKALWFCIATNNLYNDFLEKEFFEKELLNQYYLSQISPLIEICEDYLSYLQDLLPQKELIEDEFSKFKGVLEE